MDYYIAWFVSMAPWWIIGFVVTVAYFIHRGSVLWENESVGELAGMFLSSIFMWPITLIMFNFTNEVEKLPEDHPIKQVIRENVHETGSPFGW